MMPAHPPGVIPTPERPAAGSPDAQVERLINAAEHLRSMPPNMQRFMKAYPNFYRTIARHVRILLRRSPIPADGQMTIWDRALLTITRNGADVGSAVPIQFFCEHWCEYDPASGAPTEAMYDMAKLAVLPWDTEYRNFNSEDPIPDTPRASSPIVVGQLGARNQTGLRRLISTYETAVAEYHAVESLYNDKTLHAAKYLRDTAENTILYLKETDIDRGKLSEIEAMYESAKHVVQSLTGKIRKFDEGYRPREPQAEGSREEGRAPRGREKRSYEHEFRRPAPWSTTNRGGVADEVRRPASPDPYARRADEGDRRRRSTSPVEHEDRGTSRRDRESEGGIRIKGKGQQGKGHSGIPFGYREDRTVDRYQPDAY